VRARGRANGGRTGHARSLSFTTAEGIDTDQPVEYDPASTTTTGETMTMTRSLAVALPYRSVLEATVHQLSPGDTYWFRLTVDEGLEGGSTTSLASTMSRQYLTYDEAVAALNAALRIHYS